MRVLHLSYNEQSGGAARAAQRLHAGLARSGIDSHMLVMRKSSRDTSVTQVALNRVERVVRRATIHRERPSKRQYPSYSGAQWTTGQVSAPALPMVERLQPDVVHLHWIGDGLLSIDALVRLRRPLVWTLHDVWTLTGGCHYPMGCNGYQRACGSCPQLSSSDPHDLSYRTLAHKRRAWAALNVTLVTPSRWMAACVRASALFSDANVHLIPNGIDTDVYRPRTRRFAREVLNLPQDKPLILFGAYSPHDERKGFAYLQAALREFPVDVGLILLGERDAAPRQAASGLDVFGVGFINDERLLALVYAAADVFVAPSVEDNLPNTVMEALACGLPCVAFRVGGLPEMIDHQVSGYLAEPFDADDLRRGILWVLEDAERHARLSHAARETVEARFTLSSIAAQHTALYHQLKEHHERRR